MSRCGTRICQNVPELREEIFRIRAADRRGRRVGLACRRGYTFSPLEGSDSLSGVRYDSIVEELKQLARRC
jgi:hypothetical protein